MPMELAEWITHVNNSPLNRARARDASSTRIDVRDAITMRDEIAGDATKATDASVDHVGEILARNMATRATDATETTDATDALYEPTGHELFVFRQNHAGMSPRELKAGGRDNATTVGAFDGMTAADVLVYRQNHAGRSPWESAK